MHNQKLYAFNKISEIGVLNKKAYALKLELIIDDCEPSELSAPANCSESDFIQAALRAAKHSKSKTRAGILKDVSLMLNCNVEDLSFMFQTNATKKIAQIYKLDLPDYRLQSSEIYLEAAE